VKGFEEIIGRQSPESCVVFLKMCVALFFYGPTCSIIYVKEGKPVGQSKNVCGTIFLFKMCVALFFLFWLSGTAFVAGHGGRTLQVQLNNKRA